MFQNSETSEGHVDSDTKAHVFAAFRSFFIDSIVLVSKGFLILVA